MPVSRKLFGLMGLAFYSAKNSEGKTFHKLAVDSNKLLPEEEVLLKEAGEDFEGSHRMTPP
jgi:hypothetical protein